MSRYARQSHENGAAKTFLAIEDGSRPVFGFRLTRIAIDRSRQEKVPGGQLLLAAGRCCIMAASVVGGTILIIDAKNDRTAAWYGSHGALSFMDTDRTLVLSLATIANLLIL